MRAFLWTLAALVAIGCGGDASPPTDGGVQVPMHHARRVDGTLDRPVSVDPLFGLFTVHVRVNGNEGPPFLIDTGAPLTFVTPTLYPGITPGTQSTSSLQIGELTLRDVPVVGADPFGLAPSVGGVLGVNLICQFACTWDWRGRRFVLGAPPTDVETEGDPIAQIFRLAGGGNLSLPSGEAVAVPATRLLVNVRIEGAMRTLVFDTGASLNTLTDDLIAALGSDGRGNERLDVLTQGGVMHQTVLRVRELQAFGVTRTGVAFVGYSVQTFASIAAEVGMPVDGLLGPEFFQEFLTTINYPRGQVVLRRYRDQSHVHDRWTRVGILLGTRDMQTWQVAQVFDGTDALRVGIPQGAEVRSIDGHALAGMSRDAADDLLRGEAGAMRTIDTTDRSYTARVEDVIPLR